LEFFDAKLGGLCDNHRVLKDYRAGTSERNKALSVDRPWRHWMTLRYMLNAFVHTTHKQSL